MLEKNKFRFLFVKVGNIRWLNWRIWRF